MRLLAFAGALAVAACSQGDTNNVAATDEMTTTDPATTDLNFEANAGGVDQAIEQTDQQSGIDEAAGNAADSVGNTVE